MASESFRTVGQLTIRHILRAVQACGLIAILGGILATLGARWSEPILTIIGVTIAVPPVLFALIFSVIPLAIVISDTDWGAKYDPD